MLPHREAQELLSTLKERIVVNLLLRQEFLVVLMDLFVDLIWNELGGFIEVDEHVAFLLFFIEMQDLIFVADKGLSKIGENFEDVDILLGTSHCGTITS
jgi:hypothetical protein